MKITSKQLSINQSPILRSYTSHAFLHAIATSDNYFCNDKEKSVARISVTDLVNTEWKTETDNLISIQRKNLIDFFSDETNYRMNKIYYRKVKDVDCVEIEIQKQIYSAPYASISVFLTNMPDKDFYESTDFDNINYGIVLGNHSKDGIYVMTKQFLHNHICYTEELPVALKLEKSGKNIYISYKTKKHSEEHYLLKDIKVDKTYNKIGFAVTLCNSTYMDWIANNYINVYYRESHEIKFDFLVNDHKDYKSNISNFLIDYSVISEQTLKDSGINIIKFIKNEIIKNHYIEADFNDNINLKRSDENGTLFHQDLIYGFNDHKKIFNVMFIKNGKPCCTEFSYNQFNSQRNKLDSRLFFSLSFNPNAEPINISKNHIKQLFIEFKNGENISNYCYLYEKECVFGLPAIKCLTRGRGLEYITMDIRIPRVLYERCQVNLLRFGMMKKRKMINENDYEFLRCLLLENIQNLEKIQNLILKRMAANTYNEDDLDFHYEKMNLFYENEVKITDFALSILSQ